MPTITQIKAGLKATLALISPDNGYVSTLADDHIYEVYTDDKMRAKTEKDYPKCFVMIDEGKTRKEPSRSLRKSISFIVLIVVKQNGSSDTDPQTKIERFIEDVDAVLVAHPTLQGTVHDCTLNDWTTDAGHQHPEGVAAFYLEAEYFVRDT